jgi:hypothetical protein
MKILVGEIDGQYSMLLQKTGVESLRPNSGDIWIKARKKDDVSLRNG